MTFAFGEFELVVPKRELLDACGSEKPIYAGERYVVMGWALGRDGRKSFCGTAIYDAEGAVCAAAHATWFQI